MAEEKRLRRAQRQERERQDRERPALAGTMTAARQKMGLRVWSHMLRQWTLLGVRSGLQEWKLNYKLSFCTRDRDKAPFDPSGPLIEPIGPSARLGSRPIEWQSRWSSSRPGCSNSRIGALARYLPDPAPLSALTSSPAIAGIPSDSLCWPLGGPNWGYSLGPALGGSAVEVGQIQRRGN